MNKLQSYRVDPRRITVSGISAGGFMAHQLHIAYSDIFSGAGLIGSGPYYCAENSLSRAVSTGMRARSMMDIDHLVGIIAELERHGAIAPTANLANHKVWAFWGMNDTVVQKPVVDSLDALYRRYVNASNIHYVSDVVAPHAMITDNFGTASANKEQAPFINNCGYDAAGKLLEHLNGKLKPRAQQVGEVAIFDQGEFLPGATWHSVSERGLVYVPTGALEGRTCKLHVALHGCGMHIDAIGQGYAQLAGYNEWAEANDIIVLYPQAKESVSFMVFNPKASWDWFGLDDRQYHTRAGRQMRMIARMVNRLAGDALAI